MLKLIKPGSKVWVGDRDLEATVRSVMVENEVLDVSYYLSWWKDGERKTAWVPASEVEFCDDTVETEWKE